MLLIFLSFSEKIRKSEECNRDVTLASREPNDLIASSCFMAPESVKMCQMLQAGIIL
jgi:hypothetical protein